MWTADSYVITAGDLVPATHVGRAWYVDTRSWGSVHNSNPRGGGPHVGRYVLRHYDIRVLSGTGGVKSGIQSHLYVALDPLHPEVMMLLRSQRQSVSGIESWYGEVEIPHALVWRIHQGGVDAGDVVTLLLGYEVKR